MHELDLRDKKLLYEIDFDARKTYSELAKTLRMSKRGVEYKLKNLEDKEIIEGYYPVIDLSRLGYYYFRVFIKLQNLSKDLKNEISKFVLKEKEIGWSIWFYGEYDFGFIVWAKSVSEFQKIARRFYFTFDKYIKERRESIGTELVFYKNRYLLGQKDSRHFSIKEKEGELIKLDEIDANLLKLLVSNPRGNIVDFADNLNESPKRVAYRLKRLISEKILLGIRPSLKHKTLGRTYYKIFMDFNNIDEEKIKKLQDYVQNDCRVMYLIKALGTCDFDIELMVESNQELFDFIEDLQTRFPGTIKGYKTIIFGDTIKVNFLPFDV